MYYDVCTYRRGGRVYQRELLREGWRENGKVRKRTLANVTDWPDELKAVLRAVLGRKRGQRGKKAGHLNEILRNIPSAELTSGRSAGALWVLKKLADRLGVSASLGTDREGLLALWQVMARVQDQGSRLSAVRLARDQLVEEVLELERFDENDLYENLDWLAEHQRDIEERLFRQRYDRKQKPELFLYDVTSTYLEGTENELSAFGYNRDKKKGKQQLVVGLLTDEEGCPLSVEVFAGNTADPSTVSDLLTYPG